MKNKVKISILILSLLPLLAWAEDGSRLWLRFSDKPQQSKEIITTHRSPTMDIAEKELASHWNGKPVELRLDKKLKRLKDGYIIQSDKDKICLSAGKDAGLLYAAYHLLRLQQTGVDTENLYIEEIPSYDVRILNHWDNLNGSIERGYAGRSLWKWEELPGKLSPRYQEYARANASVGINATVLNNVNASPQILTGEYLHKVKALADIFRPYGIKVYLSANFSSPKVLDGLPDSDPMNKEVRAWWKNKVKEIYRLIPDFGGFLVKANSEGQPGPQDYGRTHADGANMLADALKPYGGIVMWRAFVYSPTKDDRAKQACLEFMPLDGQFRDNVIIQIKNGPVDFQPREPFNPLFGSLKKTAEMVEFQITQEYLGFSNHLVFLAPLFKEVLDSDTYSDGSGSTVAKITDGTLRPAKVTAISGVVNTGDDVNWCGHHFAQSNWYTFGRLAWNHQLTSEQIADEWIKMTFTPDEAFVKPVKEMMLTSREACVDYMMPLGLHHIFSSNHHYGPGPWEEQLHIRRDWTSRYYHNADAEGLGFDRTKTGSNAVAQYFPPLDDTYGNIVTCPDNLILWFHHVPWKYKMKNGRTMWDELCYRYDAGVKQVREYQKIWDSMQPYVDEQRFQEVQAKLRLHARDAVWWKDGCLLYFQTYSNLPIPYDIERSAYSLEEIKKVRPDIRIYK
ncbi:alpha-glucuronidase [Bacteroides sp. 51]|uniref:alpha-glucuronidase n=1 Tax=Bacteroides sp. 51 TaxID=2302938 RepID=UPI0013D24839|nr:alpha-glucuronidase [Bacteroides sp. 51]NDV81608.1 alpha-glucuronidase [Bacteroides sp. 51]